ncbi:MAG TPA: haloacid dehalogenase type II [Anaerolineales bacterium]|jgi:2-haloacid dehalogenase|nr:haloacid dehalogenase type II [Anaerolineales bacterium]
MKPGYQLITFDIYSALFDIESSLLPIIESALDSEIESLGFLRTWRQKQMEYVLISNSLQRGRISFKAITRRALDYVLRRASLELPQMKREDLALAWDRLRPWPEAEAVVAEVKAKGYVIGALSNGDEAMLRALQAQISTAFDHFFASDQAGYYKPHPAIYALPLKALDLSPDQVLHVAGSANDTLGAKSAGLHCAWSNRFDDVVLDPKYGPDYEFKDLRGLLSVI